MSTEEISGISHTPAQDTTDVSLPPVVTSFDFEWLDDQPGYVPGFDPAYISTEYEIVDRKSHSSQSDVAEAWAEMEFPAHNPVEHQRGIGAEIYTLSSYTESVDGPSVAARGPRGMRTEAPAARAECNICGWTGRIARDVSTAIRGHRFGVTGLTEHFESEHPDVTLTDTSSTEFDGTHKLPAREVLGMNPYNIEQGKRRTVSEKNFRAIQFPDGSGVLIHYSTREALRSRHGVVLDNRLCFSAGNAHCTTPPNVDMDIPFDAVEAVLEDDESLYDVTDTTATSVSIFIRGDYDRETGEWDYSHADVQRRGPNRKATRLLHLDSGAAVVVAHDDTLKDWHENHFAYRLSPDEVASLQTPDMALDLLKPERVSEAESNGYSIVGSDSFGGDGSPFRDTRLGDVVVRQGEWMFVPEPDFEPSGNVLHPYQRNWGGYMDIPDAEAERLTDGLERLGSHKPREIAVEDGSLYVRGSVRHTDGDHDMIHLEDEWHSAHEATIDGVVADESRPDSFSGRSGGTSRVRMD